MFRPKSRMLRVLLALICIIAGGLSLYITLFALLMTVNSFGNASAPGIPEKIGRGIGVLMAVLLMIAVVVFFFRAAYRLLKTTKKKDDEAAIRGKMVFRVLWGIGCFLISAICAAVVLLNILTFRHGRFGISFKMPANQAMILVFFTMAAAFFLWRGIRWMRYPKKDKGAIELLGEEF
ncbi:hypothetical protein [Chitinophaga arvensicola]|uniref:Uncharacterized protein n=1 Tax=Chitinophaga arvensicola TaxID=29529 RepID=A0A1I0SC93_9BACT|nr:hypothetical protein [Chitinophaga arvensicola]SEW54638.1 hypothetical protein SAMN04488122_6104 [Chitinophaga arvensicola]